MVLASTPVLAEPEEPRLDPQYCRYRLTLAPSHIHRWGVFAAEPIPARFKVIEYVGEKISRRETKRRSETREHIYLFTLDDYWTIDGAVGGSGAEYVNHCCHPNLRARILRGHILYISLRDIAPGEELTIDYRFARDDEKISCSCGAKNCRGTINMVE